MNKIEPTILKGTRDFLPEEQAKRNYVMAKIRGIFKRFGYAEIETPILSPAETILGKYGEEGDRLTYHFKDAGDRNIALPYDITVPFARYVAANWGKLPMPFKHSQIQRVWRAEKPQKGRLREFYQCEVNVVGTKSLIVEAEIALVIVEVFEALGIKDFKIKFNSRRLMNAALTAFGVDAKDTPSVIRIIDKLEKVGKEKVVEELKDLGIKKAEGLLASLAKPDPSQKVEISEFLDRAKALGIQEKYLEFDPYLARGLDYYTGIIFEVFSKSSDIGSICSGGRFDNLTAMFEVNAPKSADPELSGMGIAFGFERIMILMEEKGLLKDVATASEVLVTIFDEPMTADSLAIYRELIDAGANAELYFEPAKLEKQFKFADKKKIPYVVLCGPEEKKKKKVILKNMQSGEQEALTVKELTDRFHGRDKVG